MSAIALTTALCLPALDIEALLQGRTIAAISSTFRNPSRFLLCPVDTSLTAARLESRYHTSFLKSLKPARKEYASRALTVRAWARCKTCRIFSESDNLAALSSLTAWSAEYFYELVQERHKVYVIFLQVHRFDQAIELIIEPPESSKAGTYIDVPGAWSDQNTRSLLSDSTFASRQKQLIQLTPPLHPELHNLQTALVATRENSLGAMALDRDLRYLLGWSRAEETQMCDSDLSWIEKIAQAGNKGNTDEFENLVHKSLLKLGFSNLVHDLGIQRDEGVDVYCQTPYEVIGKCKADGQSNVSNLVIKPLVIAGSTRLQPQQTEPPLKVVFAAGPLTEQAQKSANGNKMNVIRPDTLQRLTELKARFPGSIDLLSLKRCLQHPPYGEAADEKIAQFVEETFRQLKIRAAVIQAVKICLERTGQESVRRDPICATYASIASFGLSALSVGEIHDILIELSSPVAGYLGRIQAESGRELFYFLRELRAEDSNLTAV